MSRRRAHWLLGLIVVWYVLATAWSASSKLHSGRYWDERFSVNNATGILVTGNLHPLNAWYASLSYLPQTAILAIASGLHEATGADWLRILDDENRFTPTAYYIARLVSVLCGAGTLILTFLVGRRLFSIPVALLGTAILATIPAQLWVATMFKADVSHQTLNLLAFFWMLAAVGEPSSRRYVVSGIGVGLATAAKYTGALAAIPLIVRTALSRRWWGAPFRRLALAGLTTVGVFLLFHPFLGFYFGYFQRSFGIYQRKGGFGFFAMLYHEGRILLLDDYHGPWLGALALVGLGLLCVRLVRVREDRERFVALAMFLSFPLGYSLIYAAATRLPKGNNYVVLLPFTALAAGWLVVEIWQRFAALLPARVRRPVLWPALGLFLVFMALPGNAFVYRQAVPETVLQRVGKDFRQSVSFGGQRLVIYEPDVGSPDYGRSSPDRKRFGARREVARLAEVPELELDLADAEVFRPSRLRGPDAAFYQARIDRLSPRSIRKISAPWYEARGSAQMLLVHPWYPRGEALPIEWTQIDERRGRFAGRLPEGVERNRVASLDLLLPRGEYVFDTLAVGHLELEPYWNGWDQEGERMMTRRFIIRRDQLRVRLRFEHPWRHPRPPVVTVWHWSHRPPRGQRGR